MFVESLVSLSAKKVAESSEIGCYENFNWTLEEPFNSQVVAHLTRIPEQTGLKFNFDKLDTQKYKLSPEDLSTLHNHNIRSLVIDTFQSWKLLESEDKKSLDIVSILTACLNPSSRQNLKNLRIIGSAVFPDDWVEKVAEMLPNLQSFECEIKTEKEFRSICEFFPKLVHLKVLGDSLKTICGIGRLKSLQVFDASFLQLDSPEQLKELFEIPNLRILDIPFSQDVIRNILLCDATLPNLRYLECYGSDITEEQMRTVVEKYPSLQLIGIIGTSCELIDFSNLNVLQLATFKSTMNVLRQMSNRCDQKLDGRILNECMSRVENLLEHGTMDGFEEEVFLDLMMKVALKLEFYYKDTRLLVKILTLYFKRVPQHLDSIAGLRTQLLVKRQWAAETVLRYSPGDLKIM
uniref:F-box/LRR-repeat protein n=1 Tax=Caenorhabditis tropicalis TaxID=1561998 RepID=A0A1I7TC24_9PELO